jgi:PAS domain S-box-containing protein
MSKSSDNAVILLMLDENGRFLRWSRAAEQLTGYSSPEMVGKFFWEALFFPDDIEAVRHEFDRIMFVPCLFESIECRWNTLSGASRWMSLSNFECHFGPDGSNCLALTATDNSEYRGDRAGRDSLVSEFVRARETARRAIATFIHDTVAQSLVVLSFSLEAWQQGPEERDADKARGLADHCCRQIRLLSHLVAPPEVAAGGFFEAIEFHTRALREADVIDIDFRSEVSPDAFSAEVGAALFFTIHELTAGAVANHAGRLPIVLKREGSFLLLETTGAFEAQDSFCDPVRELASVFGGRFEIMRDGLRVALPIAALAA